MVHPEGVSLRTQGGVDCLFTDNGPCVLTTPLWSTLFTCQSYFNEYYLANMHAYPVKWFTEKQIIPQCLLANQVPSPPLILLLLFFKCMSAFH